MKNILFLILTLLNPIYSMFVQAPRLATTSTRSKAAMRAARPTIPTIQKRTLYKPQHLKGLYSQLSESARPISPVFGAAKYESGVLQKMYSVDSDTPAITLVKTLFFQRNASDPIKPTSLKSNPAYSLSPSILGMIMGALETNKIQEPATRASIIQEWITEHKNITNGDKISKAKIEKLLDIIAAEYTNDKNSTRSILLAFLYAKANPDNNHDMLHYMTSLSRYMPIFASEEPIKPYTFTKESSENSWMEKLKTIANTLKNYIYTPSDYAATQTALANFSRANEAIAYAENNFEETISLIFKQKEESMLYPPKVLQSYYGFKNQTERPNCVETTFQGIYNIMLYDSKNQIFDLSLLPANIQPIDEFKQFYSLQSTTSNVNSPIVGQAFMDLVSDIPDARYSMENYELKGGETFHNFIVLMNHFFQLNATNLEELSKALSDARRTITFTHNPQAEKKKINIIIQDNKTHNQLEADFCFQPGHGWLETPKTASASGRFILNPYALSQYYQLTPEAQALFSMQAPSFLPPIEPMPASFYYTFDVNENNTDDNVQLIKNIINTNTINTEAMDYAYTLFQQLPKRKQLSLFPIIFEKKINKHNNKFNNAYKTIPLEDDSDIMTMCSMIVHYGKHDQEALDYAYELFQQLSDNAQIIIFEEALQAGISDHTFINLYKTLKPESPQQKSRIVYLLMTHARNDQEALDYAYNLTQAVTEDQKTNIYLTAIKSTSEKVKTTFKDLYKKLKPKSTWLKTELCLNLIKEEQDNPEAFDYAYTLFTELPESEKLIIFSKIMDSPIAQTHENSKTLYKFLQPENPEDAKQAFVIIIQYYKNDPEAINYAYEIYQKMSPRDRYYYIETILETGIWQTNKHFSEYIARAIRSTCEAAVRIGYLNIDLITKLYDIIDDDQKRRFLTIVLGAIDTALLSQRTIIYKGKEVTISEKDLSDITKKLISLGCDVNAPQQNLP